MCCPHRVKVEIKGSLSVTSTKKLLFVYITGTEQGIHTLTFVVYGAYSTNWIACWQWLVFQTDLLELDMGALLKV